MNEAGEVSIDGSRAGTIAEQVLNCRRLHLLRPKGRSAWSIAQLVQDYESTVIVWECSGMADPAEVVDAVTDVYVSRMAKLERIFCHAAPVPLPETGMAELVTRNAIRYADDVILNKRDLYIPGHWEQFRETITRLNPYSRLWKRITPGSTWQRCRCAANSLAPPPTCSSANPGAREQTRRPRPPPSDGDDRAPAEASRPHTVHGMDEVLTGGTGTREGIFRLKEPGCRSFSSFAPHQHRGSGHAAR